MRLLGRFLVWLRLLKPPVMCNTHGVTYMKCICAGWWECLRCEHIYYYPRGRFK